MPPLVSLMMLVRDEERTLERAIRSADGLADEIVVGVDEVSADGTEPLAERLGARVVRIPFSTAYQGHFARAHNHLDGEATGIWGVKLDGHEHFRPGHAVRLRRFLENESDDVATVAVLVVLSAIEGGGRGLSPRVYRRGSGARYEGAIHEVVVGARGRGARLPDVVVEHDRPKDAAIPRSIQRLDRGLARAEEDLAQRPEDPGLLYHLARLHLAGGRQDTAFEMAGQALEHAGSTKPAFQGQVHLLLAVCLLSLDRPHAAWIHLRQAQAACWNLPQNFLLRAEVCRRLGEVQDAEAWALAAMECPSTPWDYDALPRYRTWALALLLARLACARNGWAEARAWLDRAQTWGDEPDAQAEVTAVRSLLPAVDWESSRDSVQPAAPIPPLVRGSGRRRPLPG